MSKPAVRVIVSVLIGLAIVLAVFASAQAASPGAVRGQTHLTAGLLPDASHQRAAVQKLQSFDFSVMGEHDCYSDELSSDD
jgi:hypothetical protein